MQDVVVQPAAILGEWGLIGFITILMGTAIYFMRKRRKS